MINRDPAVPTTRQWAAGIRGPDGTVELISPSFDHPVQALLHPIFHGLSSKDFDIFALEPKNGPTLS